MKTLILVRHGKSSWEYSVGDKDRPLLVRGIQDAYAVADKFSEFGLEIDAAYSSPANRALHTAMIFLRQTYFPLDKFQVTNALYDFTGNDVLHFVKQLDDRFDTVVIFGHNHAFTYIANSLGNSYIDNVPTSGLVQLQFNVEHWASLEKGTTKQIIFPKQLRK